MVVVVLAVALAVRVLGDGGSDDGTAESSVRPEAIVDGEGDGEGRGAGDATVPPAPADGLTVVDRGVTVVEERFDPARREATFAVVVDNPNGQWTAEGVEFDVAFVDAAGEAHPAHRAFAEVVLPEQRVAIAASVFDVPPAVVDVRVDVDVARWHRSGPVDGGIEVVSTRTTPSEPAGATTTVTVRSNFGEALAGTVVTSVLRDVAGRIVGGGDAVVDELAPGVDQTVDIVVGAGLPGDRIAATDVFTTVGVGLTVGG